MTEIALAVVAVSLTTLSVGVAGLLRRVTDVKLALGGYSGRSQFMIDIGRELPAQVVKEIPEPRNDALIVVGSDSCDICRVVLAELDAVRGQVIAGLVRENGDAADVSIASCTAILSADAIEVLVREFDLSQVPVAIAQRDGYVIGAAYGNAIENGEMLQRFWSTFGTHQAVEVVA